MVGVGLGVGCTGGLEGGVMIMGVGWGARVRKRMDRWGGFDGSARVGKRERVAWDRIEAD